MSGGEYSSVFKYPPMKSKTTSSAVTVAGCGNSPEYVDSKGLRAMYGLSRSMGYALINDGSVKSVCLRKRGALRGKRLWVADSVREYLNRCIDVPVVKSNQSKANSSKSANADVNKNGLRDWCRKYEVNQWASKSKAGAYHGDTTSYVAGIAARGLSLPKS